jgi:hypothetical protein
MTELLSRILIAEYAAIALFFAKFWSKSRDRLFLMFSGGFVVIVDRESLHRQEPPVSTVCRCVDQRVRTT